MSNDIVIIDSGGANIASLMHAFARLGVRSKLTSDAGIIRAAPRAILPGVGSAADAMQRLRDKQLIDVIRSLQQPVLGICLGMQLLAEASEEDDVECLGVIPGTAVKLPADADNPVPNMGWCPLQHVVNDALVDGIDASDYFYFLHSYALPVTADTLASTHHAHAFSAIARHNNFVASQFHPERSASAGSRFLKTFLELTA